MMINKKRFGLLKNHYKWWRHLSDEWCLIYDKKNDDHFYSYKSFFLSLYGDINYVVVSSSYERTAHNKRAKIGKYYKFYHDFYERYKKCGWG